MNATPPWLTKSIKNKIKSKHRAYHKFLSRGSRPEEEEHINYLRNETNCLIVNAKDDCFYNLGQKLSDPSLGPKSYWTILNKILNKKSIQISHPYSLMISLCQIFKRKPTYLMIFLWNNALHMTMEVHCQPVI